MPAGVGATDPYASVVPYSNRYVVAASLGFILATSSALLAVTFRLMKELIEGGWEVVKTWSFVAAVVPNEFTATIR